MISINCVDKKESEIFLSNLKELPSLTVGDFTIRLETEDPSPELKEIARKELRETPEVVEAAKQELRELLKADKELNVPYDNDAWLVRFLRPTKFYPESAHRLIKDYYKFKSKHKDIYDGLLPSREKNVFEQNILLVLPNRDQLGRRILVIELGKKWKPKKCSLDDVFKGIVLFLEAAMYEPTTQIAGAQVIFDMDGLTMQQAWQFTPAFAKRIVDWLQDSVALRVKGLHIVNQPFVFNMVFSLFKPFLREKLRSRIYFHGTDRDSLHQHLSPKCLPDVYGGAFPLPKISSTEWFELLKHCDEEYLAINSFGIVVEDKKKKSNK